MISHQKMYDGKSHQNFRSVSTCVASVYGVGELMSTVRLGNMSASIFDLKEDDSLSLSKVLCFAKVKTSVGQVLTDRWASTDCYSPSSRSRLQRWAGLQPARGRQQKLVSSGETRTPIQPHQDTSTVQRLLNDFHMQCCKGSLMAGPHSLAVSFLKKQIIQAPQIGRNTPKNEVHFLMWEVIQMTWVGLFGSLKTQRNS